MTLTSVTLVAVASYNVPFRRLMIVYCLWRLLPSVPNVIQNRFLFDIQHDTEQGTHGVPCCPSLAKPSYLTRRVGAPPQGCRFSSSMCWWQSAFLCGSLCPATSRSATASICPWCSGSCFLPYAPLLHSHGAALPSIVTRGPRGCRAQVILVAAPSLPASWLHPAFIAYSIVGAFTARVTFEDAMLADCIEYDQLFSGKRREGQYQVRRRSWPRGWQ